MTTRAKGVHGLPSSRLLGMTYDQSESPDDLREDSCLTISDLESHYCARSSLIRGARTVAINSCPSLLGCIVSQKRVRLSCRLNTSSRSTIGTRIRAAMRRIELLYASWRLSNRGAL